MRRGAGGGGYIQSGDGMLPVWVNPPMCGGHISAQPASALRGTAPHFWDWGVSCKGRSVTSTGGFDDNDLCASRATGVGDLQ